VELVVDNVHLGTSESAWSDSPELAGLAELDTSPPERAVVVSPHPDDETFGAGGLVQRLLAQRTSVTIVAVTDGEASHPSPYEIGGDDLRAVRASESMVALGRLGWDDPKISRWGLPDGHVEEHIDSLSDRLAASLLPGDLCVAPWWLDGHPDHDACGIASRRACAQTGATYLGYLVWAWHWANPQTDCLPWASCRRVSFSRRAAARKRWATAAFVSQTNSSPSHPDVEPVLPQPLLRRFWRPFEVFVVEADS
jgi:LmbE family N-acetylglucosaminyl deacetylase